MSGFFGGRVISIIDEPKKYKFNLLEEYKNVFLGKAPQIEGLVPLINWFSNDLLNIHQIQHINKNFFWSSKSVLSHELVLNINKYKKWIKYPKKAGKEELDFLIPYICRIYGWSEREFNYNKDLFDLSDNQLHKYLDTKFGFNKKELKILGIKREKIKVKFEKIEKTKGFF